MSTSWTVTRARAALPEILERVAEGDEVELTRHGEVVAVVVSPEALRTRRAGAHLQQADALRRRLTEAAGWVDPPRLTADEAETLAADVRDDRDAG